MTETTVFVLRVNTKHLIQQFYINASVTKEQSCNIFCSKIYKRNFSKDITLCFSLALDKVLLHLRDFPCTKSVQIRSLFWSVFSCIRTEYGNLIHKSLYSVRIEENTNQKKLRIWTLCFSVDHMKTENGFLFYKYFKLALIIDPANIYLFKFNNRSTSKKCEIVQS